MLAHVQQVVAHSISQELVNVFSNLAKLLVVRMSIPYRLEYVQLSY
jgi:hypothetical protein